MSSGNIASPDLQWLLIKDSNCFIKKQTGSPVVFSTEPGNLKGLNQYKYSGLANRHTVDVSNSKSCKGFEVSFRKDGASPYSVKDGFESKEVKSTDPKKIAKEVAKITVDDAKRGDLHKTAVDRALAISRSKNGSNKPQRERAARGNKNSIDFEL